MLYKSTVGIPWSSRKHPLDKTEYIAPMDPSICKKASPYLQSLKYHFKALEHKSFNFEHSLA